MASGIASRKSRTGAVLGVALLATLLSPVAGTVASASPSHDPATWTPFVLTSADQFRLAAPSSNRSDQTQHELRRLETLQTKRTRKIGAMVRHWNNRPATFNWTQEALDMIVKHRPPAFPTRTARLLALLHVARMRKQCASSQPWRTFFSR